MNNSLYDAGMKVACGYDVSSNENSVVLYSVSFQPTKENRDKAFQYIKENPGKIMIDHTDCGAKLIEMGLENASSLSPEEVMTIWGEASRRFISAARGNVTAFVDNADQRSVFRTVELPNILKNDNIRTINQIDKFKFAQRFK